MEFNLANFSRQLRRSRQPQRWCAMDSSAASVFGTGFEEFHDAREEGWNCQRLFEWFFWTIQSRRWQAAADQDKVRPLLKP
jgi:hypothetical protein